MLRPYQIPEDHFSDFIDGDGANCHTNYYYANYKCLRILIQGKGNCPESFALLLETATKEMSSTLISSPLAKIFENFAHFRVLRSNLAKILTIAHPPILAFRGLVFKILGGGSKLTPPRKFWGGAMGQAPWPSSPASHVC